jgi:hypothetical protein
MDVCFNTPDVMFTVFYFYLFLFLFNTIALNHLYSPHSFNIVYINMNNPMMNIVKE